MCIRDRDSPATLTVADGKMTATIAWSSPNYDYMVCLLYTSSGFALPSSCLTRCGTAMPTKEMGPDVYKRQVGWHPAGFPASTGRLAQHKLQRSCLNNGTTHDQMCIRDRAMAAMAFVLAVARRVQRMSILVICGVMIGYICSAVTEFVVAFAQDSNIVNLHNLSLIHI